jgi:hypothetical protein
MLLAEGYGAVLRWDEFKPGKALIILARRVRRPKWPLASRNGFGSASYQLARPVNNVDHDDCSVSATRIAGRPLLKGDPFNGCGARLTWTENHDLASEGFVPFEARNSFELRVRASASRQRRSMRVLGVRQINDW